METNPKILLVEDETNFGEVLMSYLEMNDFDVTLACDGEEGLAAFKKGKFDLCVFDVMMPKKDGFTLAQDVRELDSQIPIVFLTAKNMKEDILQGFKVGADDYISKPFSTEEFLYRLQAILKRSSNSNSNKNKDFKEIQIGKYLFNYPLRQLLSPDGVTQDKLSPKEADLLRLFCQHKNDVVPRSVALKEIWGEDNYFTARSMDVFVTKLRKYLKQDSNLEIVNIHGNGFQLQINNG
jgi:two-component system OmpR family response regulator